MKYEEGRKRHIFLKKKGKKSQKVEYLLTVCTLWCVAYSMSSKSKLCLLVIYFIAPGITSISN